ncbi:MAG: HD domain-containing protein [Acidimicrobiales bacterium]|jgi:phosphonate degradation associated HDIG domain protein|nr:HD domain-containing protein [Acidimicrobiales bacterium]
MKPAAHAASVAEVLDLLTTFGADRYDEEVSQLDHALQCAALARRAGASDDLVAAALLHDVGHLLALAEDRPFRAGVDDHHETAGAAWLTPLFPSSVTGPIAAHVRAKRHLAATDPDYLAALSPASTRSLEVQGGPLSAAEAAAFAAGAVAADAVALRRWDDLGKVDGLEVAPLAAHVDLLTRLADRRTGGGGG